MNIREFAFNLQKVYQEMSDAFGNHQKASGLNCLSGCGRCCLNPEIEASIQEMIPMALNIYDEGKVEEWLTKLENTSESHCLQLIPGKIEGQGTCAHYGERPSVCRMFGVAGTFSKHRDVTLAICKYIRAELPELTSEVEKNPDPQLPMIPYWSAKLTSLDINLTKERMPINKALKLALEKLALLSQYSSIT